MKIVYRDHAVSRMMVRRITPEEVAAVLKNPDGKIKQSANKWIYYRKLAKREENAVAVVTVIVENTSFEVITVMINFEVK